jgi:hypothetical protein
MVEGIYQGFPSNAVYTIGFYVVYTFALSQQMKSNSYLLLPIFKMTEK